MRKCHSYLAVFTGSGRFFNYENEDFLYEAPL